MATRGFSAQLLSLTLLLSLANVNPAFTQLEKVELTEILESALTSKGSRIKKQNIEILAPRLAGATMYEFLIDKYAGNAGLAPETLMFCGTFAVIGEVRGAARFEMEIEDPVLGRKIEHGYNVTTLPHGG